MIKKADVYAVILAGGSGTRFWPMSRQNRPKQFLDILGNGTLFRQTLDRIRPFVLGRNIVVVTNKRFQAEVRKQASGTGLLSEHILCEPSAKNTAPAIYWAALKIAQKNPNAVMLVLPSDHLVRKQKAFLKVLRESVRLADDGYLVTLGIKPTRPDTGYGYLKTKNITRGSRKICLVQKFTEKPRLALAKKYFRQKNYFWNSGMFAWNCMRIIAEFEKHLPGVSRVFGRRTAQKDIVRIWRKLPSISIDYGILEKAGHVAAVPADIGWSDVGSWEALAALQPRDRNGNITYGDAVVIDSRQTQIYGNKRLIAAVGLDNITIVDTGDALLVCPTGKSQDVRKAVDALKKQKRAKQL